MTVERLGIDSNFWMAALISPAGTATGTSRDAHDDKFLALAVTGQVDAIISGDRDLLDLVAHEGIPIVTPATMLQRLREP